jgi:hypothetical protein
MAEQSNQPEQSKVKLDGIAIGGKVMKKNHWPAKEGKEPSWSVEVGYFGGKSYVNVSQQLYDRISVGTSQVFLVSQRSKDGSIYNTAIES